MIDPRFYCSVGPLPASELAAGFPVWGDGERLIARVAAFGEGAEDAVCYLEGKVAAWPSRPIGCLITHAGLAEQAKEHSAYVITSAAPRAQFARIAARVQRLRSFHDPGPEALVEAGARVAATAVISPGCEIGAGAEIGPYCVIGPGVAIGRGTQLGAHCVVQCALIGDLVKIGPGNVIGEAGFGVAGDGQGLVDMPHFGRVIIQDRVRIGANCNVDRGMLADTIIAEDCKIDNLCHVAHNVTLGRGVIIAAFGGISGTVSVGDGVRMGGRVGIADHVHVGAGASLAAGSAVLQDVAAGETVAGYPAKSIRAWMRETAWLKRAAGKKHDGA